MKGDLVSTVVPTRPALVAMLGIAMLAGCSTASTTPSSSASASVASGATPTPEITPTEVASASGTPLASPVQTSLDPCQMVTSAEASTLTGVSFGPGQESTAENNAKICSYGQEGNIFAVMVEVAPDLATAAKGKQQFLDEISSNAGGEFNWKNTVLNGFAPGIDAGFTTGSYSAGGLSIKSIAFYLLKGTVFLGFSDVATLGGNVPTGAAMEAQAKVSVGRLP